MHESFVNYETVSEWYLKLQEWNFETNAAGSVSAISNNSSSHDPILWEGAVSPLTQCQSLPHLSPCRSWSQKFSRSWTIFSKIKDFFHMSLVASVRPRPVPSATWSALWAASKASQMLSRNWMTSRPSSTLLNLLEICCACSLIKSVLDLGLHLY